MKRIEEQVTIKMSAVWMEKLRQIAEEEDSTVAGVIRMAVRQDLEARGLIE